MTLINYIIIGLAILIPGGLPVYLLWRYRTKKQLEAEEELQESVKDLTTALLEAADTMIGDAPLKTGPYGVKYKTVESKYLADSTYLTTLITAITKKYGSITLTEEDFLVITKRDYISLYIDLKTNNIILKANNIDQPEEVTQYVSAQIDSDEDIYH
jgi:hypothetical protein